MLILRSPERETYDVPAEVRVLQVVSGTDPRCWQRWRVPRVGHATEILLWRAPEGSDVTGFTESTSGASICPLVEDSMDNQLADWQRPRRR